MPRLLLAALTCLLIGNAVALAVISPGDSDGSAAANGGPDGPESTAAPGIGGVGDLSVSGGGLPERANPTSGTPRGPAATEPAGAAGPTALSATAGPPKPGSYTYRTARVAEGKRSEGEENERVGPSNGGRLYVDRGGTRDEWLWTAKSASLVASGAEGGPRCQFEPPVVWWAFPMRVGATWSGTSRCTIDVPDYGTVEIERSVAAEIVRAGEADAVGGRVPVWVIETKEKVVSTSRRTAPPPSGAPGGSLPTEIRNESDVDWTLEFAPSLGVAVRQVGQSKSKSSFDDKTREQRTERVLLSVPA